MFGADRIDGELGSLLKLGLGEEETAVHFCFHSPAFSLRFSLVTFHLQKIQHKRHNLLSFGSNPKYFRHLILGRDLLYPTTARVNCGDASSERSYSHGISGVYDH
jgi:hypothetical protein